MTKATIRRAETRAKILDAAGALFRAHGMDGVGVDAVMQEAGLTHGGFYLHFESKEALAAAAAGALLEKAAARWEAASQEADRAAALRGIVEGYLDRGRVAAGRCCVLATLGTDVARRELSRAAVGGALRRMLEALTRLMPGGAARRRERGLVALSTMVGAVVLARLSDDPALAEAFLATAEASVLGAVGRGKGLAVNRSGLADD